MYTENQYNIFAFKHDKTKTNAWACVNRINIQNEMYMCTYYSAGWTSGRSFCEWVQIQL